MNELFTQVQPVLVDVLGTILAGVFAWAAVYAKAHFQASYVKLAQDVFQKALEQGAGLALTQLPPTTSPNGALTVSHPAVQAAVEYVQKAVPDAIRDFNLKPFDIAEKIVAKIGVLTAPAAGKRS